MIKNERQYKITRAQAIRFSNALESLRQRPNSDNSLHPLIAKAQEENRCAKQSTSGPRERVERV